MTTLVTGATGFVASNVVRRLASSGEAVISYDISEPTGALLATLGDLASNVTFAVGDVRDAEALERAARDRGVDRIVHAAVITAADPEFERVQPDRTVEVNVMGTVRLLELARTLPHLRRFIYISSSGVYGTTKDQDIDIDEEYPADLPGIYAISKFASERLTQRYGELFGLDTASVRIGGPYGPMDHLTWARIHHNVVADVIGRALAGETIVATQAGLDFVRDWTYVGETARGIEALLLAPRLRHPLYNLGAGVNRSIRDIIEVTAQYIPGTTYRVTGDPSEVNINLVTAKPRGPMSIRRIREDTGFVPEVTLEEGIRRSIDWWRDIGQGREPE